jgi:hypothetical protein
MTFHSCRASNTDKALDLFAHDSLASLDVSAGGAVRHGVRSKALAQPGLRGEAKVRQSLAQDRQALARDRITCHKKKTQVDLAA